MVILFSTPTCAPCKVAEAQFKRAGIKYTKVDLTTDPEALAALKERTGTPFITTPMFEYGDELFTMNDLRNIIQSIN